MLVGHVCAFKNRNFKNIDNYFLKTHRRFNVNDGIAPINAAKINPSLSPQAGVLISPIKALNAMDSKLTSAIMSKFAITNLLKQPGREKIYFF